MEPRIEPIALDQALRLGAATGIKEVQAAKHAYRTLAHHPDLVRHVYGLLLQLSNHSQLDTRLREMVIMRIAWTTGCAYAWFQHFRIAWEGARYR